MHTGLGLGRTAHAVPFQCSVRVTAWVGDGSVSPTTQALLAEVAAYPVHFAFPVGVDAGHDGPRGAVPALGERDRLPVEKAAAGAMRWWRTWRLPR